MKDFYYILGTGANCTLDEIKEAYKKLSKKFHPDLNPGDAYFENYFIEIKEAYETLSDPDKRRQYDSALKKSPSNQQPFPPYSAYESPGPSYQSGASAYRRSKNRGPGMGMTVTLFLIVLILGVYIVESLSNSKKQPVKNTGAASTFTVKTHKHHKKKHTLGSKSTADSPKFSAYSAGKSAKPGKVTVSGAQPIITVKPSAPISNLPLSVNTKQPLTNKQALPVSDMAPNVHAKPSLADKQPAPVNNTPQSGSFLYATYVKPNVTGIVNMREFDYYNSPVIKTIPGNAEVFVMEKGNTYYKVSFNNNIGYVPKWSLQQNN